MATKKSSSPLFIDPYILSKEDTEKLKEMVSRRVTEEDKEITKLASVFRMWLTLPIGDKRAVCLSDAFMSGVMELSFPGKRKLEGLLQGG
jgi:hypothetical protein